MEWQIYSEFEPLPDPYVIGAAIVCTIANAHRGKRRPFTPADFAPWLREPRDDDMLGQFLAAMPPGSYRIKNNGDEK